MKTNSHLRQVAPTTRTRRGPITSGLARFAIPVGSLLALIASALVAGATFATAMALVPITIPTLMAAWVVAIGLTFALPVIAIGGVAAALERLE